VSAGSAGGEVHIAGRTGTAGVGWVMAPVEMPLLVGLGGGIVRGKDLDSELLVHSDSVLPRIEAGSTA
jgi:hypothetical protein